MQPAKKFDAIIPGDFEEIWTQITFNNGCNLRRVRKGICAGDVGGVSGSGLSQNLLLAGPSYVFSVTSAVPGNGAKKTPSPSTKL